MWIDIRDKKHFDEMEKAHHAFSLVFFFNESSENSVKVKAILEDISKKNDDAAFLAINTKNVRDVHPEFKVTHVPTLLVLKNGKPTHKSQGVQKREHYESLLYDAPRPKQKGGENKPKEKNVVVYTTPTCTWCNTLKMYLRKNRVRFREVDVSRDQRAAADLMRRSGQMGVPQTSIDGKIIVGFNQAELDRRLGLRQAN